MRAPIETLRTGRPAGTSITLLSDVTVVGASGAMHALPGSQPRVTLAYLVLHRDTPVPMEHLADVLWDGEPPSTWRPALRTLVTKVRRSVCSAEPSATLDAEPGGYRLRLVEPVEVDIEVARLSSREAEQALLADHYGDAVRHAVRAHRLAGLPFLPRARGQWVRSIDDELHDMRLRALHVLGETHLRRGEPARAARSAIEAVDLVPLHEASHRLAMRAYAASGETALAAQAFENCRRQLAEVLGVHPSPQTTDLHVSILQA